MYRILNNTGSGPPTPTTGCTSGGRTPPRPPSPTGMMATPLAWSVSPWACRPRYTGGGLTGPVLTECSWVRSCTPSARGPRLDVEGVKVLKFASFIILAIISILKQIDLYGHLRLRPWYFPLYELTHSKKEHLENQNLLKSRTGSLMLQAFISYSFKSCTRILDTFVY